MSLHVDQTEIEIRPVLFTDWIWIKKWFEDEWLNFELGPIDVDWLEHVLSDIDGVQLVVLERRHPIGLVGIVWATPDHPYHGITDLAIDPARRRQGLGRIVLKYAMNWPGHPETSQWVAYVAKHNEPPARLLRSLGWSESGSQNEMIRYLSDVQ